MIPPLFGSVKPRRAAPHTRAEEQENAFTWSVTPRLETAFGIAALALGARRQMLRRDADLPGLPAQGRDRRRSQHLPVHSWRGILRPVSH